MIIRDCRIRYSQIKLSNNEKAVCFSNGLEPTAFDFYLDNCHVEMSFNDIITVIKQEYDFPTRQSIVQAELEVLRLVTFMSINNICFTTDELK